MTAQPSDEYYIRWNTEDSFDQIPFGNLVGYVFGSVAFAKEHEVLSSEELALIHDAYMANPKPERTFLLFQKACSWYAELRNSGGDLDYEYMGNVFSLADEYEAEDKNAPYLAAFEKLSAESKEYLLGRMESFRGTRVMSSSTIDYRKLFHDYPEVAETRFNRLCSRLPELLRGLENWPDKKSFENSREIRLE